MGYPLDFFCGILSPAPFGFKIGDGCDILAYHNFADLVIFSIYMKSADIWFSNMISQVELI
jgi:hypothetical protein